MPSTAYKTDMSMEEFNKRLAEELSRCTSSSKDRVRAQCVRCLYDPREPGSALEQITACTMPSCAAFNHRPRVGKGGAVSTINTTIAAALRAFCTECIYDPGHGNGSRKQQVLACVDRNCSLWSARS